MTRRFDITLPFRPDLPGWPGDPRPVVERIRSREAGDDCLVTRLDTPVHFGTHVDAPVHFVPGAAGVEALALDVLMGPCRVVHLPAADVLDDGVLLAAGVFDLKAERLLFRTRNSTLWDRPDHAFRADYVALTPAAAARLVAAGVRLVGIDYLSIERFGEPGNATHHVLLAAGVVVVEGLDLRGIAAGLYDLACLPLKLPGADGAPARVVLSRA